MKRKNKIENFIGIYDGYIPNTQCDDAVKFFKKQDELKKTYDRILIENTTKDKKNDKAMDIQSVVEWPTRFKPLLLNLDQVLSDYSKKTSIKEFYDVPSFDYTYIKIQKTIPGEGYHVWHLEHGRSVDSAFRALVFSIYLNDVKEGGETEFLYQSMRIKPKKGRVVIFPAGFPYVHRGNQPLKGEKYLMTSWFLLPKQ
jgi:hypothetical protein